MNRPETAGFARLDSAADLWSHYLPRDLIEDLAAWGISSPRELALLSVLRFELPSAGDSDWQRPHPLGLLRRLRQSLARLPSLRLPEIRCSMENDDDRATYRLGLYVANLEMIASVSVSGIALEHFVDDLSDHGEVTFDLAVVVKAPRDLNPFASLRCSVDTLEQRQSLMLTARFGLAGEPPLSLADIAGQIEIDPDQASFLEASALDALRSRSCVEQLRPLLKLVDSYAHGSGHGLVDPAIAAAIERDFPSAARPIHGWLTLLATLYSAHWTIYLDRWDDQNRQPLSPQSASELSPIHDRSATEPLIDCRSCVDPFAELRALVEQLSAKSRELLTKQFGLEVDPPMALEECAEALGYSLTQVRTLEESTLETLRWQKDVAKLHDLLELVRGYVEQTNAAPNAAVVAYLIEREFPAAARPAQGWLRLLHALFEGHWDIHLIQLGDSPDSSSDVAAPPTAELGGAVVARFLALTITPSEIDPFVDFREILTSLSDKEPDILIARCGLDGAEPRTLEDVGRAFRLTRERIRQIESRALGKLTARARMPKIRRLIRLIRIYSDWLKAEPNDLSVAHLIETDFPKSTRPIMAWLTLVKHLYISESYSGRFKIKSIIPNDMKMAVAGVLARRGPLLLKDLAGRVSEVLSISADAGLMARIQVSGACRQLVDGRYELPTERIPGIPDQRIRRLNTMIGVLERDGPSHYSRILQEVNARLIPSYAMSERDVHAWLDRHKDIFVWAGPGTYALPEQGYGIRADSAATELPEEYRPARRRGLGDEIVALLLENGPIPLSDIEEHILPRFNVLASSVLAAIVQDRARRFVRTRDDLIALRGEVEEPQPDEPRRPRIARAEIDLLLPRARGLREAIRRDGQRFFSRLDAGGLYSHLVVSALLGLEKEWAELAQAPPAANISGPAWQALVETRSGLPPRTAEPLAGAGLVGATREPAR